MNELMIKKFRESCDYNIVLIGFMGAGKSTVARTLGEWFDMDIVEMDELISDLAFLVPLRPESEDEYSGDF